MPEPRDDSHPPDAHGTNGSGTNGSGTNGSGTNAPTPAPAPAPFHVPVGRLLALTPVGIVVGVVCACFLWGLSALAGVLQRLAWDDLSSAVGLTSQSTVWIVVMLTLTGLAVGLVVRYAPGHAGPDPATTELVTAPLPLRALPGLAAALVVMLAGGVSLGPENPIMAINVAVVAAAGRRFVRSLPLPQWIGLTTSGTIGAMFGTPVAAALMLSELDPGDRRIPLWDRLYAPLVAAATGSFVILHFTDLSMSMGLPDEDVGGFANLGVAVLVALAGAAVGVVGAYVLDPLHRLLHRVASPVVLLAAAGLLLGLLGALGGTITLFKGLDELKELPGRAGTTTAAGFLAMAGIKMLAMLVASGAGFRGGRIFPTVFVGGALGFAVHAVWSGVPVTLAVGAATTGIVVAATRNGWLSLFLAVAVVPDAQLLTPLLFATLAAWLLVSNQPELRARPLAGGRPAAAPPAPAAPSSAA